MPVSPDSSPDAWALRRGVYAVAAWEDLVFLDTRSDAYLCIPYGASVMRACEARGVWRIADEALAADLRDAGLIGSPRGASVPEGTGTAAPSASALQVRPARPGVRDLLEAAQCMADLLLNYRGRAFSEVLERARAPLRLVARPTPELTDVVARFHRWAAWAPVSGKCLLRSFMLLRLLRRHGHDAQWVFGVRTWPFQAHCWLQVGPVVLDDHVERLTVFTPIMVV
jgi:hypothetical protein